MLLLQELFHMSNLMEELDLLIEASVDYSPEELQQFMSDRTKKQGMKNLAKLGDHSPTSKSHSVRVAKIARDFAKYLGVESEMLGFNSMTHDLGKMQTPREILHKKGKFEDPERDIMDKHSGQSKKFLKNSPGHMGAHARLLAAFHHIEYDEIDKRVTRGSLTPDEAKAIKIMTIADIFDGLTCVDREYKFPDSKYAAIERMKNFKEPDPVLFKEFVKWQYSQFANEYRPANVARIEAELHRLYGYRLNNPNLRRD